MGEVAFGVKANPIPALILMVLCLVDSTGLKVPGILIADEIAVVYIAYGVIRKVWAKLNAEDPTARIQPTLCTTRATLRTDLQPTINPALTTFTATDPKVFSQLLELHAS